MDELERRIKIANAKTVLSLLVGEGYWVPLDKSPRMLDLAHYEPHLKRGDIVYSLNLDNAVITERKCECVVSGIGYYMQKIDNANHPRLWPIERLETWQALNDPLACFDEHEDEWLERAAELARKRKEWIAANRK